MPHHSFLRWFLGLLVLMLLGMAATAILVDPYGLFGTARIEGFNKLKPRATNRDASFKAALVARTPVMTLILGNSRAEIGFDPASSSWPSSSQPIINAAVPGSGIDFSERMLQHALASHHPGTVVLGLDFNDFLSAAGIAQKRTSLRRPNPGDPWFARLADGTSNPRYETDRFYGLMTNAISLDAFLDSVATVLEQNDPNAADLRDSGFNPLREYSLIARHEGYAAMFRQRDLDYIRGKLGRQFVDDESAYEILNRIAGVCGREKVGLRLVIYPYHVRLNELLVASGLWPRFEQWKRKLVQLAASNANRGADIELWDFSGYTSYTTEPVPPAGDMQSATSWYWEAGHFKHELGDKMIEVLFSAPRNGREMSGLGIRLAPANVEAHIASTRAARETYLATRSQELQDFRAILVAETATGR